MQFFFSLQFSCSDVCVDYKFINRCNHLYLSLKYSNFNVTTHLSDTINFFLIVYVNSYFNQIKPFFQLVGTDHCTFNSTQKAFGINDFRKIPNGVNGIIFLHVRKYALLLLFIYLLSLFFNVLLSYMEILHNVYTRKHSLSNKQ